MFGEVEVKRLAYRTRGAENLYPADAQLNLPAEKHSHGIRRLAALEAPRSSFQDAKAAILRQTGQRVRTRQLRELTAAAAVDFTAFYEQPGRPVGERDDVLVLSCDGKALVMRPEALREPTHKQAPSSEQKLTTRLSPHRRRRTIVSDMFTEADRRDPSLQRVRVALIDGNNPQIDRIKKEAKTRKLRSRS